MVSASSNGSLHVWRVEYTCRCAVCMAWLRRHVCCVCMVWVWGVHRPMCAVCMAVMVAPPNRLPSSNPIPQTLHPPSSPAGLEAPQTGTQAWCAGSRSTQRRAASCRCCHGVGWWCTAHSGVASMRSTHGRLLRRCGPCSTQRARWACARGSTLQTLHIYQPTNDIPYNDVAASPTATPSPGNNPCNGGGSEWRAGVDPHWQQRGAVLPVGLPVLHPVDRMGAATGLHGQHHDPRPGSASPPWCCMALTTCAPPPHRLHRYWWPSRADPPRVHFVWPR